MTVYEPQSVSCMLTVTDHMSCYVLIFKFKSECAFIYLCLLVSLLSYQHICFKGLIWQPSPITREEGSAVTQIPKIVLLLS